MLGVCLLERKVIHSMHPGLYSPSTWTDSAPSCGAATILDMLPYLVKFRPRGGFREVLLVPSTAVGIVDSVFKRGVTEVAVATGESAAPELGGSAMPEGRRLAVSSLAPSPVPMAVFGADASGDGLAVAVLCKTTPGAPPSPPSTASASASSAAPSKRLISWS